MKTLSCLLGLLVIASAAEAQKCTPDEEPTVEIHVGESSLKYLDNGSGPRPTVCRGNLFNLNVAWNDDSVERIKLYGFQPLLPGAKRWTSLGNTDAPDLWAKRHLSMIRNCEAPCSTSKKYNLPSSWSWGANDLVNVRSILMTVEMTLADQRVVSFQTLWGERP